ncbi:ribonuclease H-like YkuK family protein [Paenibacillus sp. y28]|uniref:ribonuclease H-like YkuK family protein n=1 Tax=Paenibacillus sp. y28 TaxID=3129110 RepID=UPI003017A900
MKRFSMLDELTFQNVSERSLSLQEVQDRIMQFMSQDPKALYHFVIGTDSQVHRGYTKFVTGIIIHRLGKGAWACYSQVAIPRELTSIKEKLVLETTLSQRVAGFFAEGPLTQMEELLLPHVYQGAMLYSYIDIDAGTEPVVNQTSLYVQEMVDRVEAMGMYSPRVKPYSYGASAYANRFTKQGMRQVM